MNGTIEKYLGRLAAEGNLRSIPRECDFDGTVDFSSNDYLGLSAMTGLQEEFLVKVLDEGRWAMGACASRLLATRQQASDRLESTISGAYGGRAALLFYFCQGIGGSALQFLMPKVNLVWYCKLPLAYCINLSVTLVFVCVLSGLYRVAFRLIPEKVRAGRERV